MKYILIIVTVLLLLSCKAEDIFAPRILNRTGIIHIVKNNPMITLVLISEIPITYVLDAEETLFNELIQLENQIITVYFYQKDTDYAYMNRYMKMFVLRYEVVLL